MKKITLRNDFHNSTVTVLANDLQHAYEMFEFGKDQSASKSAKAWTRRVRNALCGNHDCTCGVIRGNQ